MGQLSTQSNHFVGTELVASGVPTSAPTTGAHGFDLPRGAKELWAYVYGTTSPSSVTADYIPWIYVNVAPTPSGDTKVWIALAKVVGVPLDGSDATGTAGQAALIDLQGNIAERFAVEYTAVGDDLRGTYYAGIAG